MLHWCKFTNFESSYRLNNQIFFGQPKHQLGGSRGRK